jgi:FdhD protein
MSQPSRRSPAFRYEPGRAPVPRDEEIVVEEPLEIRVSGETLTITMRTPGHDRELAAGWLLSEGIICSRDDLGAISHCGRPGDEGYENTLDVTPAPGAKLELDGIAPRGTLQSSACGVCGRRSIDDLLARVGPVQDETHFSRELIAGATDQLRNVQPVFARTGGLHAAVAIDRDGKVLLSREDVGRHNAVDKVSGRLLLDDALTTTGRLLVVSGRTSFEIVQKAVAARFAGVISVSAPSSLAVATAERAGLLLVGFCRDGSFNAYAGDRRLA